MSPEVELVGRVRDRLVGGAAVPTRAHVAAAIRGESAVRGAADVLATVDALRGEMIGAGPLDAVLREPGVTDVLVNGHGQVWLDRGNGLELTDLRFAGEREVRRLAVRLANAAGRRLDDAVPFADVRLAGGVRLHAVLPPVSPSMVCLSFRVPHAAGLRLDHWVDGGALPAAAAQLLTSIVAARLSFVVTGGTGSGKTTLLATLLACVDPGERIVIVEDTGELRPHHPHVVRLEARAANVEGAGAIDLRRLVREALRMRPDRLVVGEVRGAECVDLLAALNVGHDGGCGTLHANSVADVPPRIEALCTAAGLSRAATHSQLAAAVQVVIHLVRDSSGRRLEAIGVVRRAADGLVEIVPAVRVVGGGRLVDDFGRPDLDALLHRARLPATDVAAS